MGDANGEVEPGGDSSFSVGFVKMKGAVFCLALLCLASVTLAKPEYPCTYKDYDLSKMYKDSKQNDYSWTDSTTGHTFYINICGVTKESCEPQYNAGCCQYDGNAWYAAGDASQGTFSDYPVPNTEGVLLMYANGQTCNGVSRVTSIEIKCDSKAGTGTISQVDETVSCRYTANMASKYACEGGSSGNDGKDDDKDKDKGGGFPWGWTIIGIFFGCVILYIIIGMAVKWKVYGAEPASLDIIPNVEFWKELPFLFYDGCKYTIRKVTMNKVCGEYTELD